ncbi:MAG: hypothetical protein Ct9H300mP15_12590 [Gemmatimonadota bacterium]|jgi:uncharacterized surface protein with fasciclin (FAS1) repeats|nr:MAG: hypothetical protein Ct9H300mP15_12590 [Gemmatimonadota bacterium]|tara:strand:- start:1139 stop:1651 length:513 start_codon:yes stop_codon:yes gene_type:complete
MFHNHSGDAQLMFKFTTAAALAASILLPLSTQAQTKDIVTTAVEAGSFSTLAAALDAADLIGVLQGDGPFTVFAPNDAAFAKLPEGTVEALLADKEALTKILTFHVVPGKVTSDAVVKISEASTVAGINAQIEVKMGEVYVSGAKVIKADIAASNGVIHVIDSVMLPPDF